MLLQSSRVPRCETHLLIDIVNIAYYHIYVDASNHYAPEPSVVYPTVYGDDDGVRTRDLRRDRPAF